MDPSRVSALRWRRTDAAERLADEFAAAGDDIVAIAKAHMRAGLGRLEAAVTVSSGSEHEAQKPTHDDSTDDEATPAEHEMQDAAHVLATEDAAFHLGRAAQLGADALEAGIADGLEPFCFGMAHRAMVLAACADWPALLAWLDNWASHLGFDAHGEDDDDRLDDDRASAPFWAWTKAVFATARAVALHHALPHRAAETEALLDGHLVALRSFGVGKAPMQDLLVAHGIAAHAAVIARRGKPCDAVAVLDGATENEKTCCGHAGLKRATAGVIGTARHEVEGMLEFNGAADWARAANAAAEADEHGLACALFTTALECMPPNAPPTAHVGLLAARATSFTKLRLLTEAAADAERAARVVAAQPSGKVLMLLAAVHAERGDVAAATAAADELAALASSGESPNPAAIAAVKPRAEAIKARAVHVRDAGLAEWPRWHDTSVAAAAADESNATDVVDAKLVTAATALEMLVHGSDAQRAASSGLIASIAELQRAAGTATAWQRSVGPWLRDLSAEVRAQLLDAVAACLPPSDVDGNRVDGDDAATASARLAAPDFARAIVAERPQALAALAPSMLSVPPEALLTDAVDSLMEALTAAGTSSATSAAAGNPKAVARLQREAARAAALRKEVARGNADGSGERLAHVPSLTAFVVKGGVHDPLPAEASWVARDAIAALRWHATCRALVPERIAHLALLRCQLLLCAMAALHDVYRAASTTANAGDDGQGSPVDAVTAVLRSHTGENVEVADLAAAVIDATRGQQKTQVAPRPDSSSSASTSRSILTAPLPPL